MNATYLAIDLKRQLRDVMNIAFVVGLPVVMYIVFGSTFGSGDEQQGAANVKFYVMTSMAVYAAAVATTSSAGQAAIELLQGWGRQIGLTPMRPADYVGTKVLVSLVVAAGGVAAVFLAGVCTGARADSWTTWLYTGLIAWLLSAIFALYGLAIAQTFRSESSVGIASAGLVLLAFFGNLFVPLGGTILTIARFTPLYGFAALARWPSLEGKVFDTSGNVFQDELWWLILNWVGWAAIFGLLSVWAVRRGRRRQ